MLTNLEEIHIPVLAEQVLEAIQPRSGGRYLDGTLGMGGHAAKILSAAPDSQICGLDRDGEALAIARCRLEGFGDRIHYFHLEYQDFEEALAQLCWDYVDGALLDLGISSFQLDTPGRGFSFRDDGPLDMRMNQDQQTLTAADIVNKWSFDQLKKAFLEYGEDPMAGKIARHIITAREKTRLETTGQLAEVVASAYPPAWRRKARNHPATRVFQSLRILVNDELGQLRYFLDRILKWLPIGGRLAIISFHSLEDRIVKNSMRNWAKGCICPSTSPVCVCGHKPEVRILHKKPVTPDRGETLSNPRSASAKMRAIEKIANL